MLLMRLIICLEEEWNKNKGDRGDRGDKEYPINIFNSNGEIW